MTMNPLGEPVPQEVDSAHICASKFRSKVVYAPSLTREWSWIARDLCVDLLRIPSYRDIWHLVNQIHISGLPVIHKMMKKVAT